MNELASRQWPLIMRGGITGYCRGCHFRVTGRMRWRKWHVGAVAVEDESKGRYMYA
jgi:hypothetical protein